MYTFSNDVEHGTYKHVEEALFLAKEVHILRIAARTLEQPPSQLPSQPPSQPPSQLPSQLPSR